MSERMKVGAVAQLVKKKLDKPEDHKGIKIFMVNDDGKPLYYEGTLILWKSDLAALLAGAREVPLYQGAPAERKVPVEVPVAFSKKGK